MKLNISNIMLVMRKEYMKWLVNPRNVMLFIVFIPTREIVLKPMLQAAYEMGQPLNMLESCIATLNSGMIMMLVAMVYLILISSFPTINGNVLFYMGRMGKKNWVIGEILFQCISALTYLSVICVVSVLQTVSESFVANGWSLVVTDHDRLYGATSDIHMDNIVPPSLYNQMSPYKALFLAFFLIATFLIIISLFFTVGCMYSQKLLFFSLMVVQIVAGSALYILSNKAMWYFVICHAFLSSHYGAYMRKYLFSPWISFGILMVILLVLCIVAWVRTDKLNIDDLNGK